jgi:PIN domain nuclease of toxin-antitoxin system
VSGYLVDTNVALVALVKSVTLSSAVRAAVRDGPNFLSVVSYWEILIKSMKGNLDVGDPRIWWRDTLEDLSATPLTVRPEHVAEIYSLPPIHRDPFDRMLIAQAMAEDLALVTTDGAMPRYASPRFRVVS